MGRAHGSSPVGWGFGLTTGIVLAVLFFLVGIPTLFMLGCMGMCAGLVGLGTVAADRAESNMREYSPPPIVEEVASETAPTTNEPAHELPPEQPPPAKPAKDEISIYVAVVDMICATDADFLDSSAVVSPANFAQVNSGTHVFITYVGGAFSGKPYYELSAGDRMRIYVYRDVFRQNFRKVEDESETTSAESSAPAEPERPTTPPRPMHEPREWSDATGKFKVTATFISFGAGQVTIRKEDGSTVKLPLDKLSEADREYVRGLR